MSGKLPHGVTETQIRNETFARMSAAAQYNDLFGKYHQPQADIRAKESWRPDRLRKEVLGLGILVAIGVTIWLIGKIVALVQPTEQAPVSLAFLESVWATYPAGTQREYASGVGWDPHSSDRSVFIRAEQNVYEMRRHWTDLSQVQKDSIVAFCHVYQSCRY